MSPASDSVLLTGGTGFLGRHVLWSLLRQLDEDGEVACLIRADSADEADHRLRRLLDAAPGAPIPAATRKRCRALWGDVTHEGLVEPSARQMVGDVTRLIHCAASVHFDLPVAAARRVNVQGTENVLRFAERLHRSNGFRRVDYIGTAYVAGDARGLVREDELRADVSFHNTYDRTKWEAEQLVRQYQRDLPIAIYRPSIVVGDSKTGYTANFRVLYWPLKVLARGLAVVAPADPKGIVDVVPVDYVIDAFEALSVQERSLGNCYHLAAGPHGESSFGELLEMAAKFFGVRKPFLVPPALSFSLLKPILYAFIWGKRRATLERGKVYFPYFAYRASFDTSAAGPALDTAGIRPPSVREYFRTIMQFCVDTNWGDGPADHKGASGTPVQIAPGRQEQHN